MNTVGDDAGFLVEASVVAELLSKLLDKRTARLADSSTKTNAANMFQTGVILCILRRASSIQLSEDMPEHLQTILGSRVPDKIRETLLTNMQSGKPFAIGQFILVLPPVFSPFGELSQSKTAAAPRYIQQARDGSKLLLMHRHPDKIKLPKFTPYAMVRVVGNGWGRPPSFAAKALSDLHAPLYAFCKRVAHSAQRYGGKVNLGAVVIQHFQDDSFQVTTSGASKTLVSVQSADALYLKIIVAGLYPACQSDAGIRVIGMPTYMAPSATAVAQPLLGQDAKIQSQQPSSVPQPRPQQPKAPPQQPKAPPQQPKAPPQQPKAPPQQPRAPPQQPKAPPQAGARFQHSRTSFPHATNTGSKRPRTAHRPGWGKTTPAQDADTQPGTTSTANPAPTTSPSLDEYNRMASALRTCRNNAEAERVRAETQINQAFEELRQAEQQRNQMKKELFATRSLVEDMQTKCDAHMEELKAQNRAVQSLLAEKIEAYEQKVARLTQQHQDEVEQLKAAGALSKAAASDKTSEHEKRLAHMQREHDAFKERVVTDFKQYEADVLRKVKELERAADVFQAERDTALAGTAQAEDRLRAAQENIQTLRQEIESLGSQNTTSATVKALEAENAELKRVLHADRLELFTQIEQLKSALSIADAKYKARESVFMRYNPQFMAAITSSPSKRPRS